MEFNKTHLFFLVTVMSLLLSSQVCLGSNTENEFVEVVWSKDITSSHITNTVLLSNDANSMILASLDGKINYIDIKNNEVWDYDFPSILNSVDFSSNGNYVAACSDNYFYLFNNAGYLLWRYRGEGYNVDKLIISENEMYAIGTSDEFVYFFNQSGELLWSKKIKDSYHIESIDISYNGDYIIIGGAYSELLYVFNKSGELLRTFNAEDHIVGASISDDGNLICVGDYSDFIYLLNKDGNVIWKNEVSYIEKPMISDNGKHVASISSYLQVFNENGIDYSNPKTALRGIYDYSMSSNGKLFVATKAVDHNIYFLSQNGSKISNVPTSGEVRDIDMSPNGKHIATIILDEDRTRTLYLLKWDYINNTLAYSLEEEQKNPNNGSISIVAPSILIIFIVLIIFGLYIMNYDGDTKSINFGYDAYPLSFNNIDAMNGHDFEIFVGQLYKKMGYYVQHTPLSGDQGADLILTNNGVRTAVQVKRYSNKVSNKAIQEVVASKRMYNCSECMVVTNNYFTSSAIELANANRVILVDRDTLMNLIGSAS